MGRYFFFFLRWALVRVPSLFSRPFTAILSSFFETAFIRAAPTSAGINNGMTGRSAHVHTTFRSARRVSIA
jgi:hypothetical protein